MNRPDCDVALTDFPLRMELAHHADSLCKRRLIVIQSRLDTHHYENHYKPLCPALNASPDENRDHGMFRRILSEHEGGYVAETDETFAEAMRLLESGFDDGTGAGMGLAGSGNALRV